MTPKIFKRMILITLVGMLLFYLWVLFPDNQILASLGGAGIFVAIICGIWVFAGLIIDGKYLLSDEGE